jgi:hypothetical protein
MTHPAFATAIALAAGLAAGAAAQQHPTHALAQVNDARSHGQLGDALLSLNEAIRLTNGWLQVSELSFAEQQQVLGFGDLAFATIDATAVPRITLERDLDPILDSPSQHGFRLSAAGDLRPTIDLRATRGILADGRFTSFSNLHLLGGQRGITVVQTDTVYGVAIEDCSFESQQVCGVHVLLPADGGTTRLELARNLYTNLPLAVWIEDSGAARSGQIRLHDEVVRGCALGHAIVVRGALGELDLDLDDLAYDGTGKAFALGGAHPLATRKLVLDARFLSVAGASEAFRFAAAPGSDARVTLSQCDLQATGIALGLAAPGATLAATLRDSRLSGALEVQAGGSASRVVIDNVRGGPGAWTLGSTGASLDLVTSLLEGVALRSSGSAPLAASGLCFAGGSAVGTAAAPIRISGSYLGALRLGPHVTARGSLARAQLGSGDVAPRAPSVGGPLDLLADLPPGLSGSWLLGSVSQAPPLVFGEHRWYFDPGSPFPVLTVAAGVRLQQKVRLTIPNDPSLVGTPDWFALLAVVPDAGVAAPRLNLPPGRRFALR